MSGTSPPASRLTPALEPLGCAARHQYPTLPARGPALALVPGFTHQRYQPGDLVEPTLPTSKSAQAAGSHRIIQPAAVWPSPANEVPETFVQGRAWQPIKPGTNQAYQTTHSSQFNKTVQQNRSTHTAHIGDIPRAYSSGGQMEGGLLVHTGSPLQKTTSPNLGNITNLPNA